MKTAAKTPLLLTATASAVETLSAQAFLMPGALVDADEGRELSLRTIPVLPPLPADGSGLKSRDGRMVQLYYDLAEVVANTKANKADIPVYLDHTTTGEAYGWIDHTADPIQGPDGGWEWPVTYTAKGEELVRSKAYRYTSMGFNYLPDAAAQAAKTAGNTRISGRIVKFYENSLVTRPALPVRALASDQSGEAGYTGHQPSTTLTPMNEEQLKLLGLTAEASADEITAALNSLVASASAAATASAAVSEAAAAHAAALEAVQTDLATAQAAAQAAQAELATLHAKQAEAQAQAAEAAAVAAVDTAITAGRFVPAAREALLTQARANLDTFTALAAAMPVHPAVAAQAGALATPGVDAADASLPASTLEMLNKLRIDPKFAPR